MENEKVSKYQEMKAELDNLKKQCHAHLSMAKNIREDNWKATKAYLNKHPEISKESICVETGCVLHEITLSLVKTTKHGQTREIPSNTLKECLVSTGPIRK